MNMKKAILAAFVILAGANAQAKTHKAVSIEGKKVIKEVKASIVDGFEGNVDNIKDAGSCRLVAIPRGHDLEVQVEMDSRLEYSLEFVSDETYKFLDKTDGDFSSVTYSSKDGKESITIVQADDAFNNITTVKNGKTISCQQDM
jgi:hypothetical protein